MSDLSVLATLRAESHFSVSSINCYLRCPRQYAFRYIRREATAHRPDALAFGSAIHHVLADFFIALRDGKPEPTCAELQSAFAQAWHQQVVGDPPVWFAAGQTADSLLARGRAMLEAFHQEAPRPHRVREVEMPFSIALPGDEDHGEPIRLVGAFDLVIQNEDGSHEIHEHKTAARRWSQDRLASDLQITTYQMVAPMLGLPAATVSVNLLLKTKQPDFEIYRATRTEQDYRDLLSTVRGVQQAIQAGAFYPRRDWQCRSCPYQAACNSIDSHQPTHQENAYEHRQDRMENR